jgi:CHAD domain-containing protein
MKPATAISTARRETPDVLKHLADSLDTGWKRYRKRLKRCQVSFSEDAVHQSRVETRRLISTLELLCAFIPERKISGTRIALKEHLDTFDKLRDTQVQLVYVSHLMDKFSAAGAFHDWLKQRESKFTKESSKAVKRIKTKRTGRRLRAFEKEIRRRRKRMTRRTAFDNARLSINRAFAQVAHLCRRVRATDTTTIHRTRVAFKRFRYMVESLSPLLPAVTEQHRRAMHGYQSMMGDIQDVEVLIAAMEKFVRKSENKTKSARDLLGELQHRRKWLIRVYLNAADKLRQFWPLERA